MDGSKRPRNQVSNEVVREKRRAVYAKLQFEEKGRGPVCPAVAGSCDCGLCKAKAAIATRRKKDSDADADGVQEGANESGNPVAGQVGEY